MGTAQSTTDGAESISADWMKKLPDAISLAKVSLPGTHDSLAYHNGARPQTQSWPLDRQYESGIR